MKNTPVSILAWCCLLLAAFLAGMFVGRNTTGGPIQTSVLTTQSSEMTPTSSAPATQGNPGTSQGNKININTASLQELMTLDGIGEIYAQRIIDYRTANGPFTDIAQLKNVNGIGDKRFDAIKDSITVGG